MSLFEKIMSFSVILFESGRTLALTCVLLTVAGCANTPASTAARACGCQDYLPSQPRPAWVDREIANNVIYQTQELHFFN